MPVSEANSRVVYGALKASGVKVVSALPETWLVHLIRMAEDDPDMILVRLAKEEEGVGVSMGAHFAGVRSALLMQNHGFLQAINGIVSGAMLYHMPLLLMISDRGHLGEKDPWQTEGGRYTRRVLDALGIVHDELRNPDEVAVKVDRAMTLAQSSLSPVALLMTRSLMWEEPPPPPADPPDAAGLAATRAAGERPGGS
ncbi:MAG TPA: thiamine pyrophosphate-binding protein [Candidatus Dormibacteraeota bacterium]|nr:thiamine pyrophosphate-binding protein [Candidatus Dormibacteraeota bacterium]